MSTMFLVFMLDAYDCVHDEAMCELLAWWFYAEMPQMTMVERKGHFLSARCGKFKNFNL